MAARRFTSDRVGPDAAKAQREEMGLACLEVIVATKLKSDL